jgi:hypothetical protein
MKARHLCEMVVVLALSGPSGALSAAESKATPDSAKEKLIGAWHMVSMEEQGPDGKVTRHADRQGMLLYSRDGHMSVQVMYPEAESAAAANPVYAQGGYEASFGSYKVDERTHTVTHHVEGSLVRALVGKDLPRAYQFSKDGRLTLRSARPDEHWSVTWEHD